jgi:hypothetical protein
MALLYGRAGRLTTKNAGFRPGQTGERRFGISSPLVAIREQQIRGSGDSLEPPWASS